MSTYALAHIIHVYCAIAFVGGVFFRNAGSSVLHTGRVSRESRREVERAMSHRAVRVMPIIVITLFYQRHRYGVQPLSANAAPSSRQFLQHYVERQNPVGSKRFGAFCHRRCQMA